MGKAATPTKELHLKLSEELTKHLTGSDEQLTAEALEAFVVDLFRRHKLSSGSGARALGVTRRDFLEILGRHQVPFFNYDEEDMADERAAVEAYFRDKGQ